MLNAFAPPTLLTRGLNVSYTIKAPTEKRLRHHVLLVARDMYAFLLK
jgi:hypothetical protein